MLADAAARVHMKLSHRSRNRVSMAICHSYWKGEIEIDPIRSKTTPQPMTIN